MNILITGGLGYVGGRLTSYFSQKGNQVYALSRHKSLDEYYENVEVLSNVDVLEKNKLENISIQCIIHLASMNEHECIDFPLEAIDVNVKGTLNWLMWAKKNNVKQFIFFSTAHVYGSPLVGNLNEYTQAVPSHPYSITHRCAEDYVIAYFHKHNLNTKVVRLSNSFGYPAFPTANRWTLLINDICKSIVEDRSFKIKSNRLQERDFISLSNVCKAIEKLIDYSIPEGDNRIFNLSNGKSRTLFEIGLWIKKIAENYFGEEIQFSFDASKDLPIIPLKLSSQKIKKSGWNPTPHKDVDEIQQTFDFFIKKNKM
ncbi:hypothetical protein APR41_10715 [Salegentibacter salinarum]|uniref:NAD-dependent epimerase/dehydratase domain-containing protein n=1 Tax=Salegentibacter salinarum TaxID=447422 RepID=A0A2N0TNH3_9FLAO|nr:SDR family oxidoreductase [Salegentibacter salinarum]PKD16248.1 hypothetical protein APR41_10715 [Salegentibacter salinarum]SKB67467.1 UDP-glucose 4-epimerase [Salegentibacter salinarum]